MQGTWTEEVCRRITETVFPPAAVKETAVGMFPAGLVQVMLVHIFQRAGVDFQYFLRRLEQFSTVRRVDQQGRNSGIVVPFGGERGEPPVVGDREIGTAPDAGVRTFAAGPAVHDPGKEQFEIRIVVAILGVHRSVGEIDSDLHRNITGPGIAAAHLDDLGAVPRHEFIQIIFEDRGGWSAVTDEIHRGEVVRTAAEKRIQCRHLAGGAGKKDLPAVGEQTPDFGPDFGTVALHIFGTAHGIAFGGGSGNRMTYRKIGRPNRSGDHSAAGQDRIAECGEGSARSAFQSDFRFPVPYHKEFRIVGSCLILCIHGAGPAACPAFYAERGIDLREQKTFRVRFHFDGCFFACCCTHAATEAAALTVDIL